MTRGTDIITVFLTGVVVIAMAVAGCRAKKDLAGPVEPAPSSTNALYSAFIDKKPDFQWFDGRARLQAETELAHLGATVQLRMRRDSLIWMSIEKLGFELGRALISPDSIWMIDRLNREYYALDFESTLLEYGAPFSFTDLQDLLAGGTASFPPLNMTAVEDAEFISLILEGQELRAQYWFDERLDVRKGLLEDKTGRRVEMTNDDFRPVGHETLPFDKYLAMFGNEESALLRLQFSEIELDQPRSLKFAIPSHYERVD